MTRVRYTHNETKESRVFDAKTKWDGERRQRQLARDDSLIWSTCSPRDPLFPPSSPPSSSSCEAVSGDLPAIVRRLRATLSLPWSGRASTCGSCRPTPAPDRRARRARRKFLERSLRDGPCWRQSIAEFDRQRYSTDNSYLVHEIVECISPLLHDLQARVADGLSLQHLGVLHGCRGQRFLSLTHFTLQGKNWMQISSRHSRLP